MAWGGSILRAQAASASWDGGAKGTGCWGERCTSSIRFQELAQTHGNASRCCRLSANTFISMLHCLRAMGKAHGSCQPGKRFAPCDLLTGQRRLLGHHVWDWSDAQYRLPQCRAGEHCCWLPLDRDHGAPAKHIPASPNRSVIL